MPKRQRSRIYKSDVVQGDDSWIEVKLLTLQDEIDAQELVERLKGEDRETAVRENHEYGLRVIRDHVVAWNWVDDDGNPMPQVHEDPDVVYKLTDMEVRFIGLCLRGRVGESELKN